MGLFPGVISQSLCHGRLQGTYIFKTMAGVSWMVEWLYSWMVGWLDGWMAVWLYGWMAVWLYGCMAVWLDGWMAVWLDGFLIVLVDGRCLSLATAQRSAMPWLMAKHNDRVRGRAWGQAPYPTLSSFSKWRK